MLDEYSNKRQSLVESSISLNGIKQKNFYIGILIISIQKLFKSRKNYATLFTLAALPWHSRHVTRTLSVGWRGRPCPFPKVNSVRKYVHLLAPSDPFRLIICPSVPWSVIDWFNDLMISMNYLFRKQWNNIYKRWHNDWINQSLKVHTIFW